MSDMILSVEYPVRPGCSLELSKTFPITLLGLFKFEYSLPIILTVPDVGFISPSIHLIVVDFPAPLGPTNPVIFPFSITNDTLSIATVELC